ncbi:MAG TPA: hypothetical protein VLQ46_00695 [Casimicrobiaceae bacterium]|nr:hypothetical protein [Casimicrobiaceae bacterium]
MKALAWLIGISVVIGIISAATGPHAPSGGATTAAETPPTSEQRAAVLKAEADRKAYYEAQDAKRSAEFARNRPTILARAKALSAAGNYQGALALGSGYLWANDAELDAITRPRPGEGSGSDRAR